MRKLFYLSIFFLIVSSCAQSREEKAISLIKPFINYVFPNIDSYDPIEYGDLEPAVLSGELTEEYILAKRKINSKIEELRNNTNGWDRFMASQDWIEQLDKEAATLQSEIDELNDSLDLIVKKFSYDTTMVSMKHVFRYYDDKQKCHQIIPIIFYFDKAITKIKGVRGLYYGDRGEEIYSEIPQD